MLNRLFMDGTVNTVEVKEITTHNLDDGRTFKVALFIVATNSIIKTKDQGKIQKGNFFLCKAVGPFAEIIEKYASQTNAEGKLISKQLYIRGELKTYTKPMLVEQTANIPFELIAQAIISAGGTCDVSALAGMTTPLTQRKEVPVTHTILEVDFLSLTGSAPKEDKKETKTSFEFGSNLTSTSEIPAFEQTNTEVIDPALFQGMEDTNGAF